MIVVSRLKAVWPHVVICWAALPTFRAETFSTASSPTFCGIGCKFSDTSRSPRRTTTVEFNDERPHEALRDATPASHSQASPRSYPTRLPPLAYPAHYEVRLVSRNGGLRWHAQWGNVSHVLAGEYVGLEEIDDGEWDLYFGPLKLGRFHERLLRVEDALGRLRRRRLLPMSPD
jgi:hypothetical protein